MNRLDAKTRSQIVAALVEGNSIRATSRMTGAAKGTVLKLLADIGTACKRYQDETFRNLPYPRSSRMDNYNQAAFLFGRV